MNMKDPEGGQPPTGGRIRIDKWLWHARFFKTRSLAAQACRSGHVRLNGVHVKKAAQMVSPGDILTFPKADDVRVVKILAPGERRGPATEAQTLFEDLAPIDHAEKARARAEARLTTPGLRDAGSGRPTKADRRALDRLRATDD